MSDRTLTERIKTAAVDECGFHLVGVADAVTPDGFSSFLDWLDKGHSGTMAYLENRREAYRHPESVLPSVRSIVMLGMDYRSRPPEPAGVNEGRVSRYAWGSLDYHDLIRNRLKRLANVLHAEHPGCRTRGVVDTAPLLERDFARLAGLGWFGKNTLLLNKHRGSLFFIAALLTDVELQADSPFEASHCGTCTRCLDACPTDAFPEPWVLDARRCISYLTIEHRGPIDHDLREGVGEWLFGCDICQDVCPWNRKAPVTDIAEFFPRDDQTTIDLLELCRLPEEKLRQRFRKTPLSRPKRAGLLRNAAIVLGNRGDHRATGTLSAMLHDEDDSVRDAAAWALGQLGGADAITALESALEREQTADVRAEFKRTIDRLRNGLEP